MRFYTLVDPASFHSSTEVYLRLGSLFDEQIRIERRIRYALQAAAGPMDMQRVNPSRRTQTKMYAPIPTA